MHSDTLTYPHGEVSLHGHLVLPDVPEPAPGILVLPAAMGISDHEKYVAGRLAALGCVALVADLFARPQPLAGLDDARQQVENLRADPDHFRQRLRAGLQALAQLPQVDAARIGAIGFCFGGMAALELARSGAEVGGVVSFHGILDTDRPARPGDIQCKVLVLHGSEDPLVPHRQLEGFMDEMRAAGVDWQLTVYGGAGHGFTMPAADLAGMPGLAYDAATDRRSWAAMCEFLKELFSPDAQ